MESLYLLIPISVLLVFVIGVLFWWSLRSGQYDDLEGPAYRLLMDDRDEGPAAPESERKAHVSVAMGGGTDLARNQADIVLLNENLASLGRGIDLSRKTLRIIRQNLWWSFAYNFTSVPLAMAGLVTPWMAGIGMAASSLLVVLNAMRLQRMPERH